MDLKTESKIPWMETAQLGAGVAAPSGELLQSAVEPFTVEPGVDRDEAFDITTVECSEDVTNMLKVDAHAGFNKAAVAIDAHTELVNNLSFSEHSSTIICNARLLWGSAPDLPLPRLTSEALNLYKKDPSEFYRAHGHYFIAGYIKEARLDIFAHIKGSDRESILKVSADVHAKLNAGEMGGSADAATTIENSAKSHKCKIKMKLLKTGMKDGNETVVGLSPSEVPKHVDDFMKRAIGKKTEALLIHYNRIDPTISTKVNVNPDMFTASNRFYEDLLLAQVMRNSLPKNYKKNLVKALEDIEDGNLKYIPRDLSGDIEKLYELSGTLEDWIYSADELEKYRHLWKRAYATNGGVPSGHGRGKWGVIPGDYAELTSLDIVPTRDKIHKEMKIGNQSGTLTLNVGPDRKICGIEVKANRRHPGDCKVKDGGLNKDFVTLQFKAEYDRGFSWTATAWSVPNNKALFELDEL